MSGTDWTLTPNLSLYKPVVDADLDQWGTHLNENADILDSVVQSNIDALAGYLPLSGGSLSGGLGFGSTYALSRDNMTRHLMLWGTTVGIAPTNGLLNYNVPATWGHLFRVGSVEIGYFDGNGLWMVAGKFLRLAQNASNVLDAVPLQQLTSSLGNYVNKSGDQMSGPLITQAGASGSNLGIGIGVNTTGFWSTGGNNLVMQVGGGTSAIYGATATTQYLPMTMNTGATLTLAADAAQPLQAVTLRQMQAAIGSGGGLADAPSDGTLYARQSAAWSSGGVFRNALTVGVASASVNAFTVTPGSPNTGDIVLSQSGNGTLTLIDATNGFKFSQSGGVSYLNALGNGSNFGIGRGLPNNLNFNNLNGGAVLGVQDGTSANANPATFLQILNASGANPAIIQTSGSASNRSIQLVPAGTGTVQAPTMAAGNSSTALATTAFVQSAVAPAANNVGRNLVTNGTFAVAQRGAGPWTANAAYTADRWAVNLSTDAVSVSIAQLTDADRAAIGDESAIQVLQNAFTGNAAAGAFNAIFQPIENLLRLSGKTVTVSFWARRTAGTATRIGVLLYQNFGTGGSPSAGVFVPAQAVTISTTWARYSATFSVPSFAGKVTGTNGDHSTWLYLPFSSGSTNNATFGNIGVQAGTVQLWGVQLEIGGVATPLDAGGTPQQILAQCQRFYYVLDRTIDLSGYATSGGQSGYSPLAFPVTMRASPTTSNYTSSASNVSASGPLQVRAGGLEFYATAGAAGLFSLSVNSGLQCSADL